MDIIELKTDVYISTPIKSIVFSYGFRKGKAPEKQIKNESIKLQTYYNNKLPISFNPLDYGKLINQKDNQFLVQIDNKSFVIINQIDNDNNIDPAIDTKKEKLIKEKYNLIEFYKNGNLIYKWKDIYINEYTFNREIGKSIYIIENNEIVLHKIIKPFKSIKKLKKHA
jgi:hypothetical protein